MRRDPPSEYLCSEVARLFGDEGADTLSRYWAQVEYTAHRCAHLLLPGTAVTALIPESWDDLVEDNAGILHLKQIKTRNESLGPWTTAEVLPILCAQYDRGRTVGTPCTFAFVSDAAADSKTRMTRSSFGPLVRLKNLLETRAQGQALIAEEMSDYQWFRERLIPEIQSRCASRPSRGEAEELLDATSFETRDAVLRGPANLEMIDSCLAQARPGQPVPSMIEVRAQYDRIVMLVVHRIVTGRSYHDRRITAADVLQCVTAVAGPSVGVPDLSRIPGRTRVEKKALFAEFDPTELPSIRRQQSRAAHRVRELDALGLSGQVDRCVVALLDHMASERRAVGYMTTDGRAFGPALLERLRSGAGAICARYLDEIPDVDEQFAVGLLWEETDKCNAWWHKLPQRVNDGRGAQP